MYLKTLRALLDARAAKRPVVLATDLDSGRQELVEPAGDVADTAFGPGLLEAAGAALRADRSTIIIDDAGVDDAGARVFLRVFNPPLRLFVVGAVHITQTLVPIASLLGYAVTVIDPRRSFASPERFPGVAVMNDWPDEALASQALDTRSALITLTHDPKLDDPALEVGLRSAAFYIGSLGSRRTHAARVERLTQAGFEAADIARIHAPLGLDLGARSPAEIAAAAIAEVTQVLRRGSAA